MFFEVVGLFAVSVICLLQRVHGFGRGWKANEGRKRGERSGSVTRETEGMQRVWRKKQKHNQIDRGSTESLKLG